jgi:ribonuclease P protein component
VGVVVPKRFAKRSVTRVLIKRQMRAVFAERAVALPSGLWVLRLRSPFDRKAFPSAASDALRAVVRAELGKLLDRAQARSAA